MKKVKNRNIIFEIYKLKKQKNTNKQIYEQLNISKQDFYVLQSYLLDNNLMQYIIFVERSFYFLLATFSIVIFFMLLKPFY